MTSFWDKKYYVCKGHYHRITDHLMVNPFTGEVFPDQWCQGQRTTEMTNSQSLKGITLVSRALWCDVGDHAFSSLDMDMEEGTRTRKQRDKYGDIQTVTVEYHVCGKHVQKFQSEEVPAAIKNGEE